MCPRVPGQTNLPRSIALEFLSPKRQVVRLASLKIEEWPSGKIRREPLAEQHHAPPPDRPFEEIPVDRLLHASSGALEDLDGDGLPELLALERRGYAHLYRNDGHGGFSEEITRRSGLTVPTHGTGAMPLDLDGDGDTDLVLTSELDVPRFYENQGDLRFKEHRLISDKYLSFWYGVAAEDVDRDGRPDLLFVSPLKPPFLYLHNLGGWRWNVRKLIDERALLREGELNFSASFGDFDDDGWPDLFVGREYLFANRSGQMQLRTEPWKNTYRAQTEGAVWADFNGDERLDLLVLRDRADATAGPTRLFVGTPEHTFSETTAGSGILSLESAEVALAEDFDNDGDSDLYLCQRDRPNYLLLNDGHGHFDDATDRSGFSEAGGCDAAVAGDLNGDGGLDLVIFRYGAPPAILLNELPRGNFLDLRVAGAPPGTDAIGARVRLLAPDTQKALAVRWVRRGQGFGSVGPTLLHFGLGQRKAADLEVRFPSGRARFLRAIAASRMVLVKESMGTIWSAVSSRFGEVRFPLVRFFRRSIGRAPILAAMFPVVAFLLALLAWLPAMRTAAISLFTLGGLGCLALGAIPGRGFGGSPPALWVLGGSLGALVLLTTFSWRRAAARRRRAFRAEKEDVLQSLAFFARDFRHSGLETRALQALERRAQNLFLDGELHRDFLDSLRDLALKYFETTRPHLAELIDRVEAAFPTAPEARRLAALLPQLERALGQLAEAGENPEALRLWQRQSTPLLGEALSALDRLIAWINRSCSCDVLEVVAGAVKATEDPAATARIAIGTESPPGKPSIRALITPRSLSWILDNLLSNALAALEGREDGRIEIVVERPGLRIAIRIRDNGPGVPPDRAETIFLFGAGSRRPGRGYGLPRSRELLGHFGGTLELEPTGPGASFLITLESVAP